jgi:hypothetical protein
MKKSILLIAFLISLISYQTTAQITLPYYNNFDQPGDTAGWIHYSISGSDDWECGIPMGNALNSSLTPPNVWATNLDGSFTNFSVMCLETPYFDFSDTTEYVLSFAHQYKTQSYHGGNIEYTVDSGQTWQLLDGNPNEKINWYNNSNITILGQPGWSYTAYSWGFKFPCHSLGFLSGNNSVKFRFQFGGSSNPEDGWVIDNFWIIPNVVNLIALDGKSFEASKHYPDFNVSAPVILQGIVTSGFNNTTLYYFSTDSILDAADSLLGSKTSSLNGSTSNWSETFNMIPDLPYGDYYIFMHHDAYNTLAESNENDNIAYCILHIDSTFIADFKEDFEYSVDWWKSYAVMTQSGSPLGTDYWERGDNSMHKIYGTHSGRNSWYIAQQAVSGAYRTTHYLESPFIDLSNDSNNIMCFWYKLFTIYPSTLNIELELSNSSDVPNFSSSVSINNPRFFNWDCKCVDMSYLDGYNNNKFRFKFISYAHYTNYAEQMVVDDIYLGAPKPDLSIEHNHSRTLNSNYVQDTIFYTLFNSGLDSVTQSTTSFFWSDDSVFDNNDQYLGSKIESSLQDTSFVFTNFSFTTPTIVSGNYYLIAIVDADSIIDEMWEENNTTVFPVVLLNIQTVPYENDFETQIDNWYHYSIFGHDDWSWAEPQGTVITNAFSGQKGFITQPNGLVSSQSLMLLYTPVFDLSGVNNPVLEFDLLLDNYTGITQTYNKPHLNISYSYDNGDTWYVLDKNNLSFKAWFYQTVFEFYNGTDIVDNAGAQTNLLFDYYENIFIGSNVYQGRETDRVTKYILDINHLKAYPRVQFRYNFVTPDSSLGEGALIDNFKIKNAFIDLTVEYKKSLMISSLSQKIKFFMHIKNQGNYISSACDVNFYLSGDSILNAPDYLLGQASISDIRPDMSSYVNVIFDAPPSLSGYNYLLYEIDPNNINTESNLNNNVGYWPLALDSISNYPYYNDFNDTIVNGWYQYSTLVYNSNTTYNHRFRNMLAPCEVIYGSDRKSGEWFTETVKQNSTSIYPYFYLESPVFNFDLIDTIFLSFDLMCTGYIDNGGNFEFSTDGGNTWIILTDQNGYNYNWYNKYHLDELNNEPGWAHNPAGYSLAVLDSTGYDLSFLKGEQSVAFRFKYRSNWFLQGQGQVQGMRVDNFKVEGYTVDYLANDTMVPVIPSSAATDFNINYSISNLGQSLGRITSTKFYWSKDSIFDLNDSVIHVIQENPINSGITANLSVNITKPVNISQSTYYLFYFTDSEDMLLELNELNNVGSFKISFTFLPNYYSNILMDSIAATMSQPSFNVTYRIINGGLSDGGNSVTGFYWSNDSIFDVGDQLLQSVNEGPIISGDTLSSQINIVYPAPITQKYYFLYYLIDVNDSINEIDESDNTGVFKIVFDYNQSIIENNNSIIDIYNKGRTVFIKTPKGYNDYYFMKIINLKGQIVYNMNLNLNTGLNTYDLPENVTPGIYIVSLSNSENHITKKVFIQE